AHTTSERANSNHTHENTRRHEPYPRDGRNRGHDRGPNGQNSCGGRHSFYKNQSRNFRTGTPACAATNDPISQSFTARTVDHLNEFDNIFKNLDITSTGGDSQLHSPMESVAGPST
ncbi:hypothetical protein V8B97DRAFT_1851248, partial [Scleroderma yunnanense]